MKIFKKLKFKFFIYFFMQKKVFSCCMKIDRDPAFRMGVGRSFHRPGTVKENVLESDFEPLCDGTTRRRSLADLRLLEGM